MTSEAHDLAVLAGMTSATPRFDDAACHGEEGQFTLVVPDRDPVLVHLGETPPEVAPGLDVRLADIVGEC